MSIVALTVSSGCHIASAAFKPTLLGNVALQCCFKNTRGDVEVEEGGKWLLLQNCCLTGASTGGCVIFWCGRGVQSQGFWVMGFFGATRGVEELFTHNFIIGLLSWDPCQYSCLHLQLNSLKSWGWLSRKDWLLRCRTRISDEDEPAFSWCFHMHKIWKCLSLSKYKSKQLCVCATTLLKHCNTIVSVYCNTEKRLWKIKNRLKSQYDWTGYGVRNFHILYIVFYY